MLGSPALLVQLCTNLVHNAIVRNMPSGGTVWVRTWSERGTATLTVENTGPVLSPALVATLSEPFRRGSERVRSEHGGVGLGLAIVQSIVNAHDALLVLTPRAEGGLRVDVEFAAAAG